MGLPVEQTMGEMGRHKGDAYLVIGLGPVQNRSRGNTYIVQYFDVPNVEELPVTKGEHGVLMASLRELCVPYCGMSGLRGPRTQRTIDRMRAGRSRDVAVAKHKELRRLITDVHGTSRGRWDYFGYRL